MFLAAFNFDLFKFSLVQGVALGALYGILAIALVLTFRMSRVVGFVHGGIATACAFFYWYLVANPDLVSGQSVGGSAWNTHEWPKAPAVFLAVLLGCGLGAVFGSIVTGRMAVWPRVTVTTFSLGVMLLLAGISASIWKSAFENVPSPFGEKVTTILGSATRHHDIAVVIIMVLLVVSLNFVLTKTKLGTQIRAIADDIDAAEMVGIPVQKISIGVWCAAGGLAGLGGVLLTPMTRLGTGVILFVLLRSTAGAVLGGFDSLPLALGGAILFGQVEAQVQGGTFGAVSSGWREVILMAVLFAGVILLARRNQHRFQLAEG
ncbi:MAG: branched-chain amino acid ABC transporter permease [Actinomycetota bacterium]|jgi:branched-chain amino acid transport system permease protein